MTDATLIADLVRAGVDPELVGRVANALVVTASACGHSTGLPVDTAAEKRRAYDRERKAEKRNVHRTSTGLPPESPHAHIDTSLTFSESEKVSKKERKKTISALFDIPEDASEENRTYAESKGWDHRKTTSEWERFRNNSIAKGKKHRNVAAAWRNWVTSPYQQNGAQNGHDESKSVLAAADRQLEQFGGMEAARAYVPGSSGPAPLGLDFGPEPPSPKLISSR